MNGALQKWFAGAACAALWCAGAHAAPPAEYEVKAAFIHNIARFVEWPATAPSSNTARLCLLGRDPFGGALEVLQGKPIGGLGWEIVPLAPGSSPKSCRVLFIAASERDNLGGILDSIGNNPVLTVGDSDGYAERGVMVNFYLEGNKVRFEINREAATRAQLLISSQLLKLARIVTRGGGAR
ncbi:MAG: hypothetical protein A2Z95_09200 [Gallionellales bacterium GWA2_60_18]|nr:MAG: hypothetical protein A2Z95_09200 [Gallionellales bacterium GWA2_60_18]